MSIDQIDNHFVEIFNTKEFIIKNVTEFVLTKYNHRKPILINNYSSYTGKEYTTVAYLHLDKVNHEIEILELLQDGNYVHRPLQNYDLAEVAYLWTLIKKL